MIKTASLCLVLCLCLNTKNTLATDHLAIGLDRLVCMQAVCSDVCPRLWGSALSQHVHGIFKDFQAQGRLGLLRWFMTVNTHSLHDDSQCFFHYHPLSSSLSSLASHIKVTYICMHVLYTPCSCCSAKRHLVSPGKSSQTEIPNYL